MSHIPNKGHHARTQPPYGHQVKTVALHADDSNTYIIDPTPSTHEHPLHPAKKPSLIKQQLLVFDLIY